MLCGILAAVLFIHLTYHTSIGSQTISAFFLGIDALHLLAYTCDMKISDRLRAAVLDAIKNGQTRYAIAKGAGLKYPTFTRWLDEGRDIRASTIDALGEYLGLELVEAKPAKPVKAKRKTKT